MPHFKSTGPGGREFLLPGLVIGLLLATAPAYGGVSASDPPPDAPAYAADDTTDPFSGTFRYDSSQGSGTVFFSGATDATGYRLYLGNTPRSPGVPFDVGSTPCDLGSALSASIGSCFSGFAGQNTFLAVTSYNQFGNESDYSVTGLFVPVTPPTGITLTPGPNSSRTIGLAWTAGTAPGGLTVETEVFRRRLDNAGDPVGGYVKLSVGSGANSLDDTGLEKDTNYEYVFRSKVDGSSQAAGSPATYSQTATSSARTAQDVFAVSVPGNAISGNDVDVTNLVDGDRVVISNISGNVTFNTNLQSCDSGLYVVNANGLARNQYEGNPFCYSQDTSACNDPISGGAHAALYMRRNATAVFLGTNGATFDVEGDEGLSMFINDCPGTNNSGAFNATVTVTRP